MIHSGNQTIKRKLAFHMKNSSDKHLPTAPISHIKCGKLNIKKKLLDAVSTKKNKCNLKDEIRSDNRDCGRIADKITSFF